MGIQFSTPWLLLLLLPLFYYLYRLGRDTVRLTGSRKALAIGLRSVILLLLVLALAGMQYYSVIERKAVVFVTDRSDSMPESTALVAWMKQAAEDKEAEDAVGIVATGLDSAIERKPETRSLEGFQWASQLNRQFSNLEAGLRTAGGLLTDDYTSRIVLVSDGEENTGDLMRQGRLLADKGIPVDIVYVPVQLGLDVAVESVKVPEKLYQAEQYALEVVIASTEAAQGELRIYEDNREISVQQVALERGENRFALQSLAKEPGFHRYRAEIYVPGDTQSANNSGAAFSRVAGPPKVLVVEGDPGTSQNILSVLDSGLIPYEVIPPEMLSRELAGYTAYESILLNNVAATRLTDTQMSMIEQAVRDYGVGLVMFGGENSFGLGGYFHTPIEKALPVYMDLQGKREIPSLGLVLVIDKSGSMAGDKIRLAQEAASRTVDLLREKDTLGILAFDSSLWWVSEPDKLTDKDKVIGEIQSIPADGGTEIYPALQEAYDKLKQVEAQRKHIILLTDGQSATNQSYEQLTAGMTADNITLSTVAIGDGADTQLLERIANLAHGRYYFTNEQSTVPAIFSREAVLVSRTYIVDQPFTPIFGQGADWSGLFSNGTPPVQAYIAATPKELAEVALMSPEPDPLLARWHYGSGRTVAWTSDVTGRWAKDWVAWDGFPQVMSQIIKWTFPQFNAAPLELSTELRGNQLNLDVKSIVPDFQGELKATITDEELGVQEISLQPTVPGQYTGQFPVTKPGAYLTKIDVLQPTSGEEGETPVETGSVTSGFVIPYSPEYRITAGDGEQKLNKLAELTGGRVLSLERPEEVFAGQAAGKKQYSDLTRFLLIAALLLWLADIAVRRLSFAWSRLFSPWMNRRRQSSRTADGEETNLFRRLQQSKEKAARRDMEREKEDTDSPLLREALAESESAGSDRSGLHKDGTAGGRRSGVDLAGNHSAELSAESERTGHDEPVNAGQQAADSKPKEEDTMNRLLAAKKRRKW
ncbi:VWA domain-containing protein [Paenibacillus sp. J2TS4]|uniref:VWA domain-containing protein n=1 Tax=Paenibacillus sp. J2TS4 TaxID=2807194 RepID=UPI001B178E74|nr:VWA domain-containing protein [Paenibacillus sp. J2TS4]GIP36678.1 chloride channel protein [Paenibacillus sp. J2TS4]